MVPDLSVSENTISKLGHLNGRFKLRLVRERIHSIACHDLCYDARKNECYVTTDSGISKYKLKQDTPTGSFEFVGNVALGTNRSGSIDPISRRIYTFVPHFEIRSQSLDFESTPETPTTITLTKVTYHPDRYFLWFHAFDFIRNRFIGTDQVSIFIWDLSSGQLLRQISDFGLQYNIANITAFTYDASKDLLILCDSDPRIIVFEVDSMRCVTLFGARGRMKSVNALYFHSSSNLLFVGENNRIQVFDIQEEKCLAVLPEPGIRQFLVTDDFQMVILTYPSALIYYCLTPLLRPVHTSEAFVGDDLLLKLLEPRHFLPDDIEDALIGIVTQPSKMHALDFGDFIV